MSANQVYMWHSRRDVNGFPEAVDQEARWKGPRFDLRAVQDWKDGYRPWAVLERFRGQPSRNPSGRKKNDDGG